MGTIKNFFEKMSNFRVQRATTSQGSPPSLAFLAVREDEAKDASVERTREKGTGRDSLLVAEFGIKEGTEDVHIIGELRHRLDRFGKSGSGEGRDEKKGERIS